MGTQYIIVNDSKKEYITTEWDYKDLGSRYSDFNNLLVHLLHSDWNGNIIRITSFEFYDDGEFSTYKDISEYALEDYKNYMLKFIEQNKLQKWWEQ